MLNGYPFIRSNPVVQIIVRLLFLNVFTDSHPSQRLYTRMFIYTGHRGIRLGER